MCYSKQEIETIVNNCNTDIQLYDVCASFNYLIENNYLQRSFHLNTITHLKFIELVKRT